jgi:hypothetical protein
VAPRCLIKVTQGIHSQHPADNVVDTGNATLVYNIYLLANDHQWIISVKNIHHLKLFYSIFYLEHKLDNLTGGLDLLFEILLPCDV